MDCYWQVMKHLEIWFLCKSKMGNLPSCSWVSNTVWMHHMDLTETLRNKRYRNCTKIVLSWTHPGSSTLQNKAVRRFASHLIKFPRGARHTAHWNIIIKCHLVSYPVGGQFLSLWWVDSQRSLSSSGSMGINQWQIDYE